MKEELIMFKKFLSGVLAAAAVISGVSYAGTATADAAAKAPKPAYEFKMDKASNNVVAVARKGDTTGYTTGNTETGTLPDASNAKGIKLKYVKKGKKGKCLYLDRSSSYAAELKNVKLGSGSWSISFWVKSTNNVSNFMAVFFTGNNITDPKNTKWVSITHRQDHDNGGDPYIWSHSISNGKNDEFPWFCYQDKEGTWKENVAIKPNEWVHITLTVNTKKTIEYGEKGKDGYVKSYMAQTYVNGALYGTGTVGHNTMSNSNRFYLGMNAWDIPFKGYFDEVKLYKSALNAKQAKAIYNSEK